MTSRNFEKGLDDTYGQKYKGKGNQLVSYHIKHASAIWFQTLKSLENWYNKLYRSMKTSLYVIVNIYILSLSI